jgi:CubicO group peptidase (beta-lactamase class C family)
MGALTVGIERFAIAAATAAAMAGACLPDGHWKQRGPAVPANLADGWEIATPASVGLDEAALATIHEELLREDRNFGTLGFLVVKNGKLVFETYVQTAEDRDRVHHIQSATKSVTALVLGIARQDGLFPDLDAPIADFLPATVFEGLDPRKRAITLNHLLTMRSGISFANDVYAVEMLVDRPADPLRYILAKPLYASPGQEFRYRDADPQLLSYVVQHVTSRTEQALAHERLLAPLGITGYRWDSMPGGATTGGFGLYLHPRDFARIGKLMLDCFRGRSAIVPGHWCAEATAERIPPEKARAPDAPVRAVRRGYGYYFWTLPDYRAFAAWGHGGQFLLMVPEAELVLVQVALPDTDYLHGGWLEDFVELTAPLFTSAGAAR